MVFAGMCLGMKESSHSSLHSLVLASKVTIIPVTARETPWTAYSLRVALERDMETMWNSRPSREGCPSGGGTIVEGKEREERARASR